MCVFLYDIISCQQRTNLFFFDIVHAVRTTLLQYNLTDLSAWMMQAFWQQTILSVASHADNIYYIKSHSNRISVQVFPSKVNEVSNCQILSNHIGCSVRHFISLALQLAAKYHRSSLVKMLSPEWCNVQVSTVQRPRWFTLSHKIYIFLKRQLTNRRGQPQFATVLSCEQPTDLFWHRLWIVHWRNLGEMVSKLSGAA